MIDTRYTGSGDPHYITTAKVTLRSHTAPDVDAEKETCPKAIILPERFKSLDMKVVVGTGHTDSGQENQFPI